VIDFEAPSSLRARAELAKPEVKKLVFKAALRFVGTKEAAEDLLSDARDRMCDPTEGDPWDPTKRSFPGHMRIVMRDVVKQERARARTRREVNASKLPFEVDAEDPNPQPDEALAGARLEMRLFGLGKLLRERISHNLQTLRVFERGCECAERPQELALALGCREQDIYNANRQLLYQANKILAEEEAAETARMKEVRLRAKNRVEPS
jgi:hypothetical protein